MGLGHWLKHNKLATGLGVLTVLLAVAVIVLAVELSNSLEENNNIPDDNDNTTETPTIPPSTPSPLEPWERDLRIPSDIIPLAYQVMLKPDLSAGVFTGSVNLKLQLTATRSWIPVHVKQLNVTRIQLLNSSGKAVNLKDAVSYAPNEFLVLIAEADLAKDTYDLSIEYTGSLTGKIVGFYESVYPDASGNSRSIATSKFEPVDARAAFPCFDEPGLKATFEISIVRPKTEYSALSNMNQISEEDGPGANEVTVKFAPSVKMSTYLVCFIVSDFNTLGKTSIENDGKQLPITVYTTPQQTKNSVLARRVAELVTKYYLNYFDIPYPLPKLDLIAIPDFVSGAMENWGLITFRETAVLFDEATNSASAKKRVALVVAHEIAHQWFGNLVTMAWWDDLWLNEGFASFMESKAISEGVEAVHEPGFEDWAIEEQVVYDDIHPVMVTDAAVNSHPIVQPVSNPDQINQLFDSVSYDKGKAVLRMLEDFLTPAKFQKGLQSYLSEHKLSNARTEDLWSHLNAAYNDAAVNVSDIMNTWTRQMGYPVVNVRREAAQVVLTQDRFLSDKNADYDENESPYRYEWDIPVRYVVSGRLETSELAWLRRNMVELVLPIPSSETFVKINYRQIGFYRVNYEDEQWKTLTEHIQELDPLDRAHLLNDVFQLASAGYTEYANALNMVGRLSTDADYLPWAAGLDALNGLDLLLTDSPAYPEFRKFVVSLVEPLYLKFGWDTPDPTTHLNRLLRTKILAAACKFGHSKCIADVGKLFQSWLTNPATALSPDLRPLVYTYGMDAIGNEENWDKMWALYLVESNAQERINLLTALAYVKEPWLIEKYLNLAWDEANVLSQDYFNVLAYIAGTPVGSPVVWDYYRTMWPHLINRFGLQHRYLGSAILSIISRFTSQTRLDELRAFYAKYPDAGAGEASRRNADEKIVTRIKWTETNADQIGDWLNR